MTTLRIAEVAERSGVRATTLRYYEQIGLLPARRSDNGYRAYDERDLDRLAFITRAKQLDISLDELAELVDLWATDDCSQVAHRLAEAVARRRRETDARIAGLVLLAGELRAAASRLEGAPASGPRSDSCPCAAAEPAPVVPLMRVASGSQPSLACSLRADDVSDRVRDWAAVLSLASERTTLDDGLAVSFAPGSDVVTELARLVAAEQACCPFLAFTLRVDGDGIRLQVRAPDGASGVLAAVFGAPALPMAAGCGSGSCC